jgi:hypothetical protein
MPTTYEGGVTLNVLRAQMVVITTICAPQTQRGGVVRVLFQVGGGMADVLAMPLALALLPVVAAVAAYKMGRAAGLVQAAAWVSRNPREPAREVVASAA